MSSLPALFIGSQIYRGSTYGRAHPLAIPRVPTVIDLCRAMGWLPAVQYRVSPRAKPAALHAFHTEDYIRALQTAEARQSVTHAERARHGLGTLSNPVYPEMFRRPATSAGGAILAANLVAAGHTVYHPAGGTHHGLPDRANGFCFLNDPVLAIMALRHRGLNRVAYVDIDAHHCDGVEYAFAQTPEVCLVSVHEEARWPFSGALEDAGAGNVFNLPVARGINDSEFELVLEEMILPVVTAHRADVVVLQCGADAVTEDPLSRMELSNNAHWRTVAALARIAPRLLVLGGGGYNPWSVGRLWSGVWATLQGVDIPRRLPPEAVAVLRQLTWQRRAGRNPPDHWFTTLRDAPRPGEIGAELRRRVGQLTARLAG